MKLLNVFNSKDKTLIKNVLWIKFSAWIILFALFQGCTMQIPETHLKEGYIEKTGQMVIPRFIPTAVLLKTGKVLVFGGQVDSNAADFKLGEIRPEQAELYDPQTGTFLLTGKTNLIRADYTTTLLQDGRVLILGGDMGFTTKDEIEIYDPKTGQFSIVGKLKKPRKNHQANLLQDGKVFITGGDELNSKINKSTGLPSYQIHDSAELFDPKTNRIELLKHKMHYPRLYHAATSLQDGRVLIIGGVRQKDPTDPSPEVEIYEPKTKSFKVIDNLIYPSVASPSMFSLDDGTILIIGGKAKAGTYGYRTEAEIFEPKIDQFKKINSMNFGRSIANFARLETGEVLVMRGIATDPFHPTDELEIFNPKTLSFRHIGTHYHARAAIALPGRKILFVGKTTEKKNGISAEVYRY